MNDQFNPSDGGDAAAALCRDHSPVVFGAAPVFDLPGLDHVADDDHAGRVITAAIGGRSLLDQVVRGGAFT